MKKIIIALILAATFSCNKEPQKNPPTTETTVTAKPKAALKLETFTFPGEVQGCSCYFAANQADFEKEKFIYIDDYGNNAFIKINGEMVKFQMDEGDFDPENFGKIIKNDKFTITIKGEKIKEQEESMMFRGTMTVEDSAGNRTETPIYGECGC